jgi:hypothetical protein
MSTGMLARHIRIVLNSRLKNIIGVIFCLSLIAGSASAQNGQAGSNRSQAILTIQVNVAPIVVSPQVQTANAQATAITYDIPTARAKFSVTEKIQEHLVTAPSGQIQHQVVKIITVVLD